MRSGRTALRSAMLEAKSGRIEVRLADARLEARERKRRVRGWKAREKSLP